MNKSDICRKMAYLASKFMQDKYVIHGTKDEYITFNEIVEDGFTAINYSKSIFDKNSVEFKEMQLFENVLIGNISVLDNHSLSNEDIIKSKQWIDIRSSALKYLIFIGFDLEKWEKEEEKGI